MCTGAAGGVEVVQESAADTAASRSLLRESWPFYLPLLALRLLRVTFWSSSLLGIRRTLPALPASSRRFAVCAAGNCIDCSFETVFSDGKRPCCA